MGFADGASVDDYLLVGSSMPGQTVLEFLLLKSGCTYTRNRGFRIIRGEDVCD